MVAVYALTQMAASGRGRNVRNWALPAGRLSAIALPIANVATWWIADVCCRLESPLIDGAEPMKKGYDLLGLYHDADDPRVVVPKRIKALGWTVNVGHWKGQAVLVALAAAILIAAVIQYG